jgi:hypothetical protein
MTIQLPDKMTVAGAEIRILLAECSTPAHFELNGLDHVLVLEEVQAHLGPTVARPNPRCGRSWAITR